jgi:SAM-dependent methyltransferase
MKCKICNNLEKNTSLTLREMSYGLREEFEYFQCSECGCIQIAHIPENVGKYYPANYYSYTDIEAPRKPSFFRTLQAQYLIGARKGIVGKLITWNYKSPDFYDLLRKLKLYNLHSKIVDIGSGNGELLKRFYSSGYTNLTGIDPFVDKDIIYNSNIRVIKKFLYEIDEQADCIMMHHSLEHMEDQHKVFAKLSSLLSPGGRMLIRIPIVSEALMKEYGQNVVSLDPPRHFYIHTIKSITHLARHHGFEIYDTVYDATEFSFWASEQYKLNIPLNNHPESHLV